MTGFVYAIGDENGRVKIGWSGDPLRRLDQIGSGCSSVVTLLGHIPATRVQEAEIQGLLKPWKVNREWFQLEGPVKAFVDMLPRSDPVKITVNAIDELIDALGGTGATAQLMGVTDQAVSNWRVRGPPTRLFFKFKRVLASRGIVAPPSLWRMFEAAE